MAHFFNRLTSAPFNSLFVGGGLFIHYFLSLGDNVKYLDSPARITQTDKTSPAISSANNLRRSSILVILSPDIPTMTSPRCNPASLAGLLSIIRETKIPPLSANSFMRIVRSGKSMFWPRNPIVDRRTLPCLINCPATKCAVLTPTANAIPCAGRMIAVFSPTTRALESTKGPPELPGLRAASV